MKGRRLKVKTRMDFIARLSQAPMMTSLEELIWNSFDERAQTVRVILSPSKLDGVEKIEIQDDGQSLPYGRAAEAFENLGCSNKPGRTLATGEPLHGRKGEGRHKALSLGNRVQWHFTYEKSGRRFCYDIVGTAGREDPFFLTEERLASDNDRIGCSVVITEIPRSLHQLLQPDARREFASVFAPFLLRHTECRLIYNGKPVRPGDAVASRGRIRSIYVDRDGQQHQVTFEVIHWKEGHKRRDVQLCSTNGIPLHRLNNRLISASDDFSVFVSSPLFDVLHEQNLLSSVEMAADEGRREIIDKIWLKIRTLLADPDCVVSVF